MHLTWILLCMTVALGARAETIAEASLRMDHLLEQIGEIGTPQILHDCDAVIQVYAQAKTKEAGLLIAQAWSVRGSALFHIRNYMNAIKSHQKSYALRQQYAGRQSMEAARSCHNLGNCYLLMTDLQEAENWLLKSLYLKSLNTGDDGSTNESLGSLYIKMDDFTVANRYLREAIRLRPANSPALVNTMLALGNLYNSQSKPDTALIWFEKALMAQTQNNPDQKGKRAVVLDKIGLSLSKIGQYQKAKTLFLEALQIFDQLGVVNPAKRGECLQNTGDCYLNTGDYEAAESYYDQALNYVHQGSFEMAALLNSMGLLAHRKDDDQTAIDLFRSAITILESGQQKKIVATRAIVFVSLGTVYLESEKWENASFYFLRAVKSFGAISEPEGQARALNKLGYCQMQQGLFDAAEKCLRASIRLIYPLRGSAIFPAFFHLGELYEAGKNTDMALLYYQQAIAAMDHDFTQNTAFLEEKALVYTAIARVNAQMAAGGKPSFWTVSLAWSKAAIEILATLKSAIGSNISVAANNHYFSETYNRAIEACLALVPKSPSYQLAAFEYMEQYKGNFARQLALNAAQFSADSSSVPAVVTKSLSDIQKGLKSGEVLLEYQWMEDKILLFEVRKTALNLHVIEDPTTIAALIQTYWRACSQYPEWIPSQQKDSINQVMIGAGAALYKRLLGDCQLVSGEKLRIAADYLLCYLPFDALVKNAGPLASNFWEHQFVIDEHEVLYVVSAAAALHQTKRKTLKNKAILALSPDFMDSEELPNLQYNQAETRRIQTVCDAEIWSQSDLHMTKLRVEASRFGILHFATHGILNPKEPSLSYLALGRPNDAPMHDRLYVKDICSMSLTANLVVMSACHSADGKLYRGEGLASLAHAFQYTGVPNVVASLWNVDDQSSPLMMEHFYKSIANQETPSRALANMKKMMVHKKRNKSHPYYWAGLVNWGALGTASE